jgi:hypothetical protein
MLTQERLKEILHYCPETGVFTWLKGQYRGSVAGCVIRNPKTGKTYRYLGIRYRIYATHRLAFLYVTGDFPKENVDHKDGNGINNAWDNLRETSHADNQKNQRKYASNTSGITGVSWSKSKNRWCSCISVKGKNKNLGRFRSKEEAIAARKVAEVLYGYHENHGTERPL